ncbi:methyltransferase family protein [Chitinophaga niastensis]|uniref:Methyltransferase family protein n=1 Tax=Chitinophaga niastensis TaxID=536980 RepID=A0A2P8HET9_CHINA|nr:class I SAM-dependent methyltransferase [Chitinophaga niastensis]PSL44747.1 methyltransferase family protein [Chitinophaga niastensis]
MKKNSSIQELLGQTDIYLIDQIMKGRYDFDHKILDAGCGTGRNMHWFLLNNMDIHGVDLNEGAINSIKIKYPHFLDNHLHIAAVEKMPFHDHHFDHVISSAVLHFANSTLQFQHMLAEMVRVLKNGGTVFIRMTSNIGIEDKVALIADGVYQIPDGTKRFLLTRSLLHDCMQQLHLSFIDPLKTVNVDDIRCMSTLVLQKH